MLLQLQLGVIPGGKAELSRIDWIEREVSLCHKFRKRRCERAQLIRAEDMMKRHDQPFARAPLECWRHVGKVLDFSRG
jgi:hypothetical protein